MYRSVGDDTNTALFTDDYMSQATQVTHAPLMRDPPKRTAQSVTAPAPAPVAAPAPSTGDGTIGGAFGSPLVMWGVIGVVAVGGVFFLTRKG